MGRTILWMRNPWILPGILSTCWVLTLICMTADSTPALRGMPMLTVNTSDIAGGKAAMMIKSTSVLEPRGAFSACANSKAQQSPAEKLGLADFYDLHMFAICQGRWDVCDWPSKRHNTRCSRKLIRLNFKSALLSDNVSRSLSSSVAVEKLAATVDHAINFLLGAWTAMSALYGLTAGLLFLAAGAAFWMAGTAKRQVKNGERMGKAKRRVSDEISTKKRRVDRERAEGVARTLINYALPIGCICSLGASFLSLGLTSRITVNINEATHKLGIQSNMGKNFVAVSYTITVLSGLAMGHWFGVGRHGRQTHEEDHDKKHRRSEGRHSGNGGNGGNGGNDGNDGSDDEGAR